MEKNHPMEISERVSEIRKRIADLLCNMGRLLSSLSRGVGREATVFGGGDGGQACYTKFCTAVLPLEAMERELAAEVLSLGACVEAARVACYVCPENRTAEELLTRCRAMEKEVQSFLFSTLPAFRHSAAEAVDVEGEGREAQAGRLGLLCGTLAGECNALAVKLS